MPPRKGKKAGKTSRPPKTSRKKAAATKMPSSRPPRY
jgi:hypothetical protein